MKEYTLSYLQKLKIPKLDIPGLSYGQLI